MSRPNIIVTGARGQLARAVIKEIDRTYSLRRYDVIGVYRDAPVWTGQIAALINCAGAYNTGAWNNPVLWERMLDSNVGVQLEYVMSALPRMTEGGIIVNVTAQIASEPSKAKAFEAAYAASKAAMSAATASLKLELQPLGIAVLEYQPEPMPTASAYAVNAAAIVGAIADRLS